MAKGIAFVRYVVFCIFFTVGTVAIAVSMLIDPEITQYYANVSQLRRVEVDNARIEKLLAEYNAQITQIERDPNMLVNLRAIALGDEPKTDGTVLPKASQEVLAQAKEALLSDMAQDKNARDIPLWVERCSIPNNRRILFVAGCGLILITFIFFGTPRHYRHRKHWERK